MSWKLSASQNPYNSRSIVFTFCVLPVEIASVKNIYSEVCGFSRETRAQSLDQDVAKYFNILVVIVSNSLML